MKHKKFENVIEELFLNKLAESDNEHLILTFDLFC